MTDLQWPPDYDKEFLQRQEMLKKLNKNPHMLQAIKEHYTKNPVDFINDWVCTYDPRNVGRGALDRRAPWG